MSCSYQDCEKQIFVRKTTRGPLCNGHYAQFKKGKPLSPLRGYEPRKLPDDHGTCMVDGCDRPSWHKQGPCQSHSKHLKQNNSPEEIRKYEFQTGKQCSIPGCTNHSKSQGYCAGHYRTDWGNCIYPGCSRKIYNKKTEFCASHYAQFRKLQKQNIGQDIKPQDLMERLKPIREKKPVETIDG